ncbi:MAG: hypothetical protein ACQSGP_06255, partial [Frankia sp.]
MPTTDTVDETHSYDVFRHYERLQWKLIDLPFADIRSDLVRPEYITLAKSAVTGEATSIAAVHGFLNEFADDYDCSAFINIWGYQELQHHYAFRAWLRAGGGGHHAPPPHAREETHPTPAPPPPHPPH